MKILFASNFFNHHQQPLSERLARQPEVDYQFIETMPMPHEQKQLGYHMEQLPGYVCPAYLGQAQRERALRLLEEADVLITGSAPETMVRSCIRRNKLVFRYSERPVKKREPLKYLPRLLRWNWRNPPGKPIYLLCASAYAAGDYARFGLFRNRAYKWGYFPETKHYEDPDALLAAKDTREILWCGRFLDWKHPEAALLAAGKLKGEGYSFRLRFIGTGEQERSLHTMAEEAGLSDCVEFLGPMSPEQVRAHMERAGIYLFTSDKQEGWGAVLNESMNSGCAVIASHAIGSVPFLLKDEENGLVFRSGDVEMLYEKIRYLLDHPQEQKRLGKAAYETIAGEWNAQVAAQRVVRLAQAILDGEKEPDLYASGPCSRAERLEESWYCYET